MILTQAWLSPTQDKQDSLVICCPIACSLMQLLLSLSHTSALYSIKCSQHTMVRPTAMMMTFTDHILTRVWYQSMYVELRSQWYNALAYCTPTMNTWTTYRYIYNIYNIIYAYTQNTHLQICYNVSLIFGACWGSLRITFILPLHLCCHLWVMS